MDIEKQSADSSLASQRRSGLALNPLVGLVLGLVAGAIVFGVIQTRHPVFRVDPKYDVPSIGMPTELFVAHAKQREIMDRKHAMLYIGGLGFLLGAFLGVGEAVARRSWLPPLLAAPLGLAGGLIGGPFGCQVYEYVRAQIGQADLMHTIRAQLWLVVPMALGVGLGLGLATRSVKGAITIALAGLAAGALAAALYPVAVSMVLPNASTDAWMPDQVSSRLLWLGVISGTIGLIIPLGSRQRKPAATKV